MAYQDVNAKTVATTAASSTPSPDSPLVPLHCSQAPTFDWHTAGPRWDNRTIPSRFWCHDANGELYNLTFTVTGSRSSLRGRSDPEPRSRPGRTPSQHSLEQVQRRGETLWTTRSSHLGASSLWHRAARLYVVIPGLRHVRTGARLYGPYLERTRNSDGGLTVVHAADGLDALKKGDCAQTQGHDR